MQSREQHEERIRRHTWGETTKDQDTPFSPLEEGNQPYGEIRAPCDDEWAYDAERVPRHTPRVVEGTVVESTSFIPPLPPQTERGQSPTHSVLRDIGRGLLSLPVALLTLLLLTPTQPAVMRLFVSLVPDAGSTATVTLVTDQVELHRAYSLLVVPPGAVLSTLSHQSAHPQAQIEARLLAAPVMTRQVTAPTTGRGHQPALYAHGLVTFYNQAPTPQAIPAGMLLGGVDGVSVVTDQAVSVPAARLPAQGQVSVQVSVSCMAETHNAKEMQSQINALNEQEATARLGSTYALQGQIAESVQAVTAVDDRQGVVRLQIQTASVWAYQLSASQIHALIASVAGDPIQKSRALLLHGRGIHQVSITSTDWWDGTSHQSLPTDPSRIKLLVISWEGV